MKVRCGNDWSFVRLGPPDVRSLRCYKKWLMMSHNNWCISTGSIFKYFYISVDFREVRYTQKFDMSFFFHFWVNTPPVLHPTEFFHCQYWNDPPNDGGSLEKSACSGRNISTIRSKIVWGARIPVIWVLIKPLNRKPRRLTRRSRATSPQSCSLFNGFSRRRIALRFDLQREKINYP